MADFITFCNQLSRLTKSAVSDLKEVLKTRSFKKGQFLLESGKVCKYLFFIDQGITKTYFYREEKEFIMKFFTEQMLFTVVDSFKSQRPSMFAILALEDTDCTTISFNDWEDLCKKHHCLESCFRKLLAEAVTGMMQRISEMLEENPAERYAKFVNNNNNLLQRISLGDLAAYIGITQVSLSRIRARK